MLEKDHNISANQRKHYLSLGECLKRKPNVP